MADRIEPERRRWNMSRIRGKDTTPEISVRKLLHGLGYRYRLHERTLPGRPDIVFPARRKVIYVHGCFWHRHPNCRFAYTPRSRPEFWERKFKENMARDDRNLRALREMGWNALVVWECKIRDLDRLRDELVGYLGTTCFARRGNAF